MAAARRTWGPPPNERCVTDSPGEPRFKETKCRHELCAVEDTEPASGS